jgi:hypothetical protein
MEQEMTSGKRSITSRGPIEQHRYNAAVISYVIGERTRGTKWKEIGENVKAKFNMRPTERQMRTWWNRYGTDFQSGFKELLGKHLMQMAQGVVTKSIEANLRVLFPLQKRCEDLGANPQLAFYFSALLIIEDMIGQGNLEILVKEYLKISDKLREGIDTKFIQGIFVPDPKDFPDQKEKWYEGINTPKNER